MLTIILNSNKMNMKKRITLLLPVIFATLFVVSCITPFEPKGVDSIDNMLVIEGDIIANDTTIVTVSYSQSLSNTKTISYVTNATVWVESETGTKYTATAATRDGHRIYKINTLTLDVTKKYKLCVTLNSGNRIESDMMSVQITPPIDSVGYKVNMDVPNVTFYVNTHGTESSSKYYKWSYNEDWEFHSKFLSNVYYNRVTNTYDYLPSWSDNRYYCWNKASSTKIIVASTENFAENRIHQKELVSMGHDDIRISYVYSMELIQQSLTKEGYQYWENIRKISDDIGGIFAPQPSEIKGNLKSINTEDQTIIGYISASTVNKKRIFAYGQLIGVYDVPQTCETVVINPDNPGNPKLLWDDGYDIVSWSFPPDETIWAPVACVDCRKTGTKKKPSFWPTSDI